MKWIILRNDDISYYTPGEQFTKMEGLSEYFAQTYGIIPFHNLGTPRCIYDNEFLIQRIVANKSQTAIHGVFHDNCKEKYEFSRFDEQLCESYEFYFRIMLGWKEIVTNVFIPPHNYHDNRWNKFLATYGFNIISGTKRKIKPHPMQDVLLENDSISQTGVIRLDQCVLIPQTVMIRRKDFHNTDHYFDKLISKLSEYFELVDLAVLTIHWYELVQDNDFYRQLGNFLRKLYQMGSREITYKNASKLKTSALIDNNFFNETRS